MKTGDKIVCIDVKGIGKSKPIALTLHNIYTIVEHNDPIHNSFNILNDDNEIGHWLSIKANERLEKLKQLGI